NGNDMVQYSVGYVDNTVLDLIGSQSYTTFGGQAVGSASILIRYTYGADANLDGIVDDNDVTALSNRFNVPGSADWFFGDFDYDGICSDNDVSQLSGTYLANPQMSAPSAAELTAKYGAAFAAAWERGAAGATAVPEPGALSVLFGTAAAGMLSRRRRRMLI